MMKSALVQRRWSSSEQLPKKNQMSKSHHHQHRHAIDLTMTPSSVPTESSTLSKKFRLFKRKSMLSHRDLSMKRGLSSGSRKRSQSFDENSSKGNVSDIDIEDLKKLKLRVTIEQAKHLSQDTNVYAIVRCLNTRNRTQVIKKSSEPNWQCTFDLSLISLLSYNHKKSTKRQWNQGIIITICSKDRFRSQFLGQIQLPFTDVEEEDELLYDCINNQANWYPLNSRNGSRKISQLPTESIGAIRVKIGLVLQDSVQEDDLNNTRERIKQMWRMLTQHHHIEERKPSVTTTPPLPTSSSLPPDFGLYMPSNNNSPTATTTLNGNDYFSSKQHYKKRQLSEDRNFALAASSPSDILFTAPQQQETNKKKKLRKRKLTATRKKKRGGFEGKFHQDVVGVTFLEICHAKDLPPERNLARTGFDMDPFVVVSYGTSTFRTNTVRHNLNPEWNEKLFFHVKHNESSFHLKFTVYDRERVSGNELVAWCQVPIQDIINASAAHQQQQQQSVNNSSDEEEASIEKEMDCHTFPLQMVNPDKWKDKRKPSLTIRAKFMPYDQIRKMFWVALAKNYDVELTGTLSRLQVQSMLETIGSTITEATIDSFWEKYQLDAKNEGHELTIDQLVDCLEEQMLAEDYPEDTGGNTKPIVDESNGLKNGMMRMSIHDKIEELEEEEDDEDEEDDDEDWAGINDEEEEEDMDEEEVVDDDNILAALDKYMLTGGTEYTPLDTPSSETYDYATTTPPNIPITPCFVEEESAGIDLVEELIEEENNLTIHKPPRPPTTPRRSSQRRSITSATATTTAVVEKVIRLSECPICHRPNLARRSQMDIITHVATCAANDWTTVDRFLMGNFLTEAYAQRRWFVKLVRKVGYGKYSLGRDNANIIVQDRRTGQLIEEKMSVYIRLGMRLVYKGMKTGIQSKGAQRILTNLTVKQGRRYDSPNSVRDIPAFIKFHKIQLHEVWKPLSSFKTFNEFFYRKLRPGSRPPDSPEDPTVAVSPADSRMIAFETVNDAAHIWVKGMEFSLKKLLGQEDAQQFEGGSLAIFRLAPQDYHRFHSPVDGTVTKIQHIAGQYYTVNPMAIRTTIDVFGENARTMVWMDSKEFGQVAVVCVGAMLVGSIIITAKEGIELKRTDEMGYFAFGGSTLIVVFQKDKVAFDHDLLNNSDKALETLVRVGNHIGVLDHYQ